MTDHDDLATSLRSAAGRFDPEGDGWAGIQDGVRTARRRRRARVGALGGLAAGGLVLAIGLSLAAGGGTDVDAGPGPFAATTEAPPTTTPTVAPAPTTTETVPTADPMATAFPGIWPFASEAAIAAYEDGDARFEDPVATAVAFAKDYVGMLDPVVQDVREAAPGSADVYLDLVPKGEGGEPVPVGGARTTLLLRSYRTSYGAEVWTVLAAGSDALVLDTPEQGAVVGGGVLRVRGQGSGYEGHVKAEVRQDGMQLGRNLGEVIGITGSNGELGPLSLDVPFVTSAEPGGALVVTTDTGLDGVGAPEFTVVRVHFAEGEEGIAGEPAGGGGTDCRVAAPAGQPAEDEMDVTVFFTCEDRFFAPSGEEGSFDDAFVPVVRRVPRDPGLLRVTLEQLFRGPKEAERAVGLVSLFRAEADGVSEGTADLLSSVTISDGTAVVDLAHTVNNASTSAASISFMGELLRTTLEFPQVEAVEYRLDGSCLAFGEWMQSGECRTFTRNDL